MIIKPIKRPIEVGGMQVDSASALVFMYQTKIINDARLASPRRAGELRRQADQIGVMINQLKTAEAD